MSKVLCAKKEDFGIGGVLGQRSTEIILFAAADDDELLRNFAVGCQQSLVPGKYTKAALIEGEEMSIRKIAVVGQNIISAIALQYGFIYAAKVIAEMRTAFAVFKAFISALSAWMHI